MVSKYYLASTLLLVALVLVGCVSPAPLAVSGGLLPGDNTTSEICTTVAQLDSMKAEAFDAGRLVGCKADVVLMNPTYAQLQQFLADHQALTKCEGNCVIHTQDLANCAYANGWEMYVVLLNFEGTGTGHVLGAFQTKDKGMVFIESQTLWGVTVKLGYDYALNYTSRNWSFGAKDGIQPAYTIKQIGIIR